MSDLDQVLTRSRRTDTDYTQYTEYGCQVCRERCINPVTSRFARLKMYSPCVTGDDLELDEDWQKDRIPEWRVKSITINGEEHAASTGNGVTMIEVSSDESWSAGGVPGEATEAWRSDPWADPSCNECESGMYDLRDPTIEDSSKARFVCDSCSHEVIS